MSARKASTMAKLVIEGQHPLHGEIRVAGMKNAATAVMAATLLTDQECVITNVPRILDVFKMAELLVSLGAVVSWQGDHEIVIQCREIDPERLDQSAVKKLRSSVLLLGPLLARFPEVRLERPGGCIIGNRPLDTHFEALKGLGASIEEDGQMLQVRRDQLLGKEIVLSEFSVTATENLLMAATLSEGRTVIQTAAAEPHVQDLAVFLRSMGASINGEGTHTITIEGGRKLQGAHHRLRPDQIEVGTWAVAAAVTRGGLLLRDVRREDLFMIVLKLRNAGVSCTFKGNDLFVEAGPVLRSYRLQALPHPGFPTDLQAPFALLATQAEGTSLIHDPLYEGRMGYVQELVKMGANAVLCDPHRVLITGPTPLYGQEIRSFDLRAGATLIVAGLIAKGETILHDSEIVDRGYEAIEERLRAVGAVMTRHSHG